MRDAAFFLIWIVLFPISFWSAHIGVLLWIWTALISPGDYFYSFMASVPYNKMIAIITLATVMFHPEPKKIYRDSTIVLLLLLAVSATISAATSIVPSDDGWTLYEKVIKIITLGLVISAVMHTRYRLHAAVIAICLAFGFDGMNDGMKFLVSAGGHKILGSISIGDNNHYALAILMTIPLLLYCAKYTSMRLAKLCFFGVAIGCVITVIGSYSRGGAIGLAVIALMVLKGSKRKFVSFALIAVAVLLIFTLAPSSWFTRVDTLNDAGEDSSFLGRVIAWKISTLIALDRPFGGGFHAVQRYPVWNHYREGFALFDFIPTAGAGEIPRAAHSIYFEILGDLGFVGFALFMALILAAFRTTMMLKRYARQDPRQQWAADLGGYIQISLLVYCTSGGAVSMAYFEMFYVLIMILSRARRTVEDSMAAGSAGAIDPASGGRTVATSRPLASGARQRQTEPALAVALPAARPSPG